MAARNIQLRGASCTKLKAMEAFLTWKLDNFSNETQKKGDVLKSRIFSAEAPGSPEWQLKLYPKGEDDKMRDGCCYISLYIILVSWRKPKPLNAKVTFAILDSDGKRTNEQTFKGEFTIDQGRGFEYFIKESDLHNPASKLLTYDALAIDCDVAYSDEAIPLACSTLTNGKTAIEIYHLWTVENFATFAGKTGDSIKSEVCSTGILGAPEWQMTMYPRGKMEECQEYVSLFVKLFSWGNSVAGETLKTKVKFSIVNSNKEREKSKLFEYEYTVGASMGSPSFIKQDFLLNNADSLLPNGSLIVAAEISFTAVDSSSKGVTFA